jgi:transposase
MALLVRPVRAGLELAHSDLTDFEWAVIEPVLPKTVRDIERVGDRRVLNGILWRLRTGGSRAAIPTRYGHYGICHARLGDGGIQVFGLVFWKPLFKSYRSQIEIIDASPQRHRFASEELHPIRMTP